MSSEQRFQQAFDEYSLRVFAYALRHTDPDSAQDVVSDVFLVAWRRIAELPDDPLPWLLVVARNTLANRRRSAARREQLELRLADTAGAGAGAAAEDLAVDRASMLAALADLTDAEREAVLLVAWDGLDAAAAARVAGCSRAAFDARLHRARARLRRSVDQHPPTPRPRTITEVTT